MSRSAYACEVNAANMQAIVSEGGRTFSKKIALAWVETHGFGFFIRDEGSAFDCQLMTPEVFAKIYVFEDGNLGALFRRITTI